MASMQQKKQPNIAQMAQELNMQGASPQQILARYHGQRRQQQPLQYTSPQQVSIPETGMPQTAPSVQDAQGVQTMRQPGVTSPQSGAQQQQVQSPAPNRMQEMLGNYATRMKTAVPQEGEMPEEPPKMATTTTAETVEDPAMLGVSSEERFQGILSDLQGSWQETQNQLARQAAEDQRRASTINAAMGRNIGGGFAGLSAQAGLAAGQNLAAARQAHNAQVRDAQMQWLDRVFQREEAARARGHQLDVLAAQTGEGLTGEAGTGIAGEGEAVEGGAIPTDTRTGEAIPHFENGIAEFNIEYPEGDTVGKGLIKNDGYSDNWEWWKHAGEGGSLGRDAIFPRGISQSKINEMRDSDNKGGNVEDKYRYYNGVKNYFGGKVPAIFAFNHGGGQDVDRGEYKNAANAIARTLGSYGIDKYNWYFDVQPGTGLWEVKDEFGKDIGVFSSDGRLVQANKKWSQSEYKDKVAKKYEGQEERIAQAIKPLKALGWSDTQVQRTYPQYRYFM